MSLALAPARRRTLAFIARAIRPTAASAQRFRTGGRSVANDQIVSSAAALRFDGEVNA